LNAGDNDSRDVYIDIDADRKSILAQEPSAAMKSDEELMTAVALGDRGAFSLLVTRYQGVIWRAAWRYSGNTEDASDICQTVLLKLYEAGSRYKISATFKTYLFRITNNTCIDHYRKKRPEASNDPVEVADSAPLPDEMLEERKRDRGLRFAISQLPERQRRAVVLRYEADLQVKEIAATMGVTQKAVERLLAHAREALRGNAMQG
jgi:RNA polymerase sigma-70 factor (ECF subfamily)